MEPSLNEAAKLEAALGPADPAWQDAVALDEAQLFPMGLVGQLQQHRFLSHFVPRADGGRLASFEVAASLLRVVSRRDLTAAIALGQCFLGSIGVWLCGSPEQRRRQADLLSAGHLAALALTEEEHGSDILASGVTATRVEGGYLLNGRKWLINNGSRGEVLTVFARTATEGGLSGFSLFVVDRASLPSSAFEEVPRLRTHGIRGADISGVGFKDLQLPEAARLGTEGSGLQTVLQGLQVTRIGCAAFSLGAADTALRVALDFAVNRQLYEGTVIDLPHARWVLSTAFVDLLICEAVALSGVRGLHAAPEQMSLTSAVVKYLVPTRAEQAMRDAAVVLGARHYLRQGLAHGIFQKMLRDAAVVSLFDGSTAVNLESIGLQLPRLAQHHARHPHPDAELARRLLERFDVSAPLPAFDGSRLQLMNGGLDDVTQGLPLSLKALASAPQPVRAALVGLGRELVERLALEERALQALSALDRSALKRSPQLFDLAGRHAALHAACACVHWWAHGRDHLGPFFAEGQWLVACLHRLLRAEPVEFEAVTARLLELHRGQKSLSLMPIDAP